MNEYLRLEINGRIATLWIDRPAKLNALNIDMWKSIPDLVDTVAQNDDVAVMVLRGGKHFSAGADISEFAELNSREGGLRFNSIISAADTAITKLHKPTIAAIQGYCVGGGCQLAVACDIRIASPDSHFAITPAKVGLIYTYEGVKGLTQLVGPAWAKQILLTGNILNSDEALRIGLVNEVTTDWENRALELAQTIAERAPISVRASKSMVELALDGVTETPPEIFDVYGKGFASADFAEGVDAFLSRRAPNFGVLSQ